MQQYAYSNPSRVDRFEVIFATVVVLLGASIIPIASALVLNNHLPARHSAPHK